MRILPPFSSSCSQTRLVVCPFSLPLPLTNSTPSPHSFLFFSTINLYLKAKAILRKLTLLLSLSLSFFFFWWSSFGNKRKIQLLFNDWCFWLLCLVGEKKRKKECNMNLYDESFLFIFLRFLSFQTEFYASSLFLRKCCSLSES